MLKKPFAKLRARFCSLKGCQYKSPGQRPGCMMDRFCSLKGCVIVFFFMGATLGASEDFRDELTRVTMETAKKIETKYNVIPCGSGGGTMYGVDFVALSFDSKHPFTVEKARAVIVGSADMIQEAINSNKIVRPYLEEYPFPIKRIKLTFFIQTPSDVKLVSLSNDGTITYSVKDDQDRYKDILEEPYRTAKEHVDEKQ